MHFSFDNLQDIHALRTCNTEVGQEVVKVGIIVVFCLPVSGEASLSKEQASDAWHEQGYSKEVDRCVILYGEPPSM